MVVPQFYSMSWDLWVAFFFLITVSIAFSAIRIVYRFWHNKADDYGSLTATLAVRGLRLLQGAGFFLLAFMIPLAVRVNSGTSSTTGSSAAASAQTTTSQSSFFSTAATNESWWCIIRLVAAFLTWAASFLFDSHATFRWVCIAFTPALMILDYCSFAAFAHDLWCFDQGICTDTDGVYLKYQLLAWRDLLSSVLCGNAALYSYWLMVLFGPCANQLYLPRREHRRLSVELDKSITAKPKLKLPDTSDEEEMWKAYQIHATVTAASGTAISGPVSQYGGDGTKSVKGKKL